MSSTILVASDGHPGALGALRTAYLLARRDGSRVQVLAVLEPAELHAAATSDAVPTLPPDFAAASKDALRARVRAQLAELGPDAGDWPLILEQGSTARTIARTAATTHAQVILVGLREPAALTRWLARETLLRLIHLAHVPVLAVPPSTDRLPRSAVVVVDFSDFSHRAARAAVRMLEPGRRIHLAHVTWTPPWPAETLTGWSEWDRSYRAGVEQRLQQVASEIGAPAGAVTTHLLAGDVGPELLRLAVEVDADLISAGSHGAGFCGRLGLGSASSGLAHGAHAALLIAPPANDAEELLEMSDRELLRNLGEAGDRALTGAAPGR